MKLWGVELARAALIGALVLAIWGMAEIVAHRTEVPVPVRVEVR